VYVFSYQVKLQLFVRYWLLCEIYAGSWPADIFRRGNDFNL